MMREFIFNIRRMNVDLIVISVVLQLGSRVRMQSKRKTSLSCYLPQKPRGD